MCVCTQTRVTAATWTDPVQQQDAAAGGVTHRRWKTGSRWVEEFRVGPSDIEQRSGQHSSKASSFSAHSNLAAYSSSISSRQTGGGAPGCYSNLLYFGISSFLQVSLSVRLSVHLSLTTVCDSFTKSCYILYFTFNILILFWQNSKVDKLLTEWKIKSFL